MDDRSLLVRKIEEGIVIDHVPSSMGYHILALIGLDKTHRFVLISNVESKKLGKKDIIKVENWFPEKRELEIIAIVAPSATVNVIKNWKVVEKFQLSPPERIVGLVKCPNPRCITNDEQENKFMRTVFERFDGDGDIFYSCRYCDIILNKSDLIPLLKKTRHDLTIT